MKKVKSERCRDIVWIEHLQSYCNREYFFSLFIIFHQMYATYFEIYIVVWVDKVIFKRFFVIFILLMIIRISIYGHSLFDFDFITSTL